MFGQHKVELFGETLMNFNILLSYKGSAVLILGKLRPTLGSSVFGKNMLRFWDKVARFW